MTTLAPYQIPFTILIDSNEKHPFSFTGINADADKDHRPLAVNTRWQHLGTARGDYTIEGYESQIAVERKSMDDAHGTILGFRVRRRNFIRELEWLASIECAAVIVECSIGQFLANAPDWGKKSAHENRKTLHRSVIAWQQQFPKVQWTFCDDRRLAEVTTFRMLERFWEQKQAEKKRELKAAKEIASLFTTQPGELNHVSSNGSIGS